MQHRWLIKYTPRLKSVSQQPDICFTRKAHFGAERLVKLQLWLSGLATVGGVR